MKRISIFVLVAAAMLISASTALAGGWAVVTLDAMPTNLVVNQPVKVAFMIRQHGKTPWVYKDVQVRGSNATGENFLVHAAMDKAGHYTADLTFTQPGTWQWAVASGLYPEWQPMPELQVANSADAETEFAKAQSAQVPNMALDIGTMFPTLALLGLGIIGFVGSGSGLIYWLRRQRQTA